MKLLMDDIFIVVPLKCATRSIRLYVAAAKNITIREELSTQKENINLFLKNTALGNEAKNFANQYKIEINSFQYPDEKGVTEYKANYNVNLCMQDYKDYTKMPAKPIIRIALVRDPVQRFVSAYNMICKNFLGSYPVQKFIDNFDTLMWEHTYFRFHFKYQTCELGLNPNWYTDIFDIKEIKKFKDKLENIYNLKLPDIYLNKTSNGITVLDLTSDQINWIKNKYTLDYNIYGGWFK